MALEEKVMAELKEAMKSKNEVALRSLRAIKSAIINAKTAEGAGGILKEEDETKLLQKLVKSRRDSIESYEKANRPELAEKEKEEIAVIDKFLPKQLTEEELKTIIAKIIAETGASSAADMGKVIGAANKQIGGQSDGKTISNVVKQLLS
ncbi:MAG: GatB/YqeY domain-containing protein [Ferruginibacter sp.]